MLFYHRIDEYKYVRCKHHCIWKRLTFKNDCDIINLYCHRVNNNESDSVNNDSDNSNDTHNFSYSIIDDNENNSNVNSDNRENGDNDSTDISALTSVTKRTWQ